MVGGECELLGGVMACSGAARGSARSVMLKLRLCGNDSEEEHR
jgi:hypothetical protein